MISDEMVEVLDRLGLDDQARGLNPTSGWQRLWQRARGLPDYVEIPGGLRLLGGDLWRLDDT